MAVKNPGKEGGRRGLGARGRWPRKGEHPSARCRWGISRPCCRSSWHFWPSRTRNSPSVSPCTRGKQRRAIPPGWPGSCPPPAAMGGIAARLSTCGGGTGALRHASCQHRVGTEAKGRNSLVFELRTGAVARPAESSRSPTDESSSDQMRRRMGRAWSGVERRR